MVNPVVAIAHHQHTTTTTLLLAPSSSQQQQQQQQHSHSLLSSIPQNLFGQQLQQQQQQQHVTQQLRSAPAGAAATATTTAAAAAAAKSNPSKRHRERLNGQLECLATLLPFEASVITKLDKLSILRLSVSFLRVKSFFNSLPLLIKEPSSASSSGLSHQRHSHHHHSSSSSASHHYSHQYQQQQQQQQQLYYNAIQPQSSYSSYSATPQQQQHHLQHLYQHQRNSESEFTQQYQHYAAAQAAAAAAAAIAATGSAGGSSAASHQQNSYLYESSSANRLIAAGLSPEILSRDSIMQALNGFLFIVQADGEVFYVTRTVEHYLGFHQSDILHQSIFDLVHSEDRHEFQKQLSILLPGVPSPLQVAQSAEISATTAAAEPAAAAAEAGVINSTPSSFNDLVHSGNLHLLERNFTARFRCLLDNTSGFTRMEVRGRIGTLQGHKMRQTHACSLSASSTTSSASASSLAAFSQHTALFALCSPFGPPAMLELAARESLFRSKHKMDLEFINMDAKGKSVLGFLYNPSAFEASASNSAATNRQNSKLEVHGGGTPESSAAVSNKQQTTPTKRDKKATNKTSSNANSDFQSEAAAYAQSEADLSKPSPLQIEGKKFYNLIHPDDLRYVLSGHTELLKTGTTGLLAYRIQADIGLPWHWLQSSLRINYKSGRGEFIIATHRALIEDEGKDLVHKRCIAIAFSNLLEYVPVDYPPNTSLSAAQQLPATASNTFSLPKDASNEKTTQSKSSENTSGNKSKQNNQSTTSNVDAATRLIRNRSMNKRPRTTATSTSTTSTTTTITTTASTGSAYATRGKSLLSSLSSSDTAPSATSYETAAAAYGQLSAAAVGADYSDSKQHYYPSAAPTTFYNIGGKLYSAAQTPSLSSSSVSPYSAAAAHNSSESAMQAAAAAAAAAAGFMFPNTNGSSAPSAAAVAAAKYSQMLAYQQQQQQQHHYQQYQHGRIASAAALGYNGTNALSAYGQQAQYSQTQLYATADAQAQQTAPHETESAEHHQPLSHYETTERQQSSSHYNSASAANGDGRSVSSNAAWSTFGNYFNSLSYSQQAQAAAAYGSESGNNLTTPGGPAAVYNPANSYYYALTSGAMTGNGGSAEVYTNSGGGSSNASSGVASMPAVALDIETLKSSTSSNIKNDVDECPGLAVTNGV